VLVGTVEVFMLVVIGAHRRPEAVVLSYERYLALLTGREGVRAILADRRASAEGMGEDEAIEMAVREQRAKSGQITVSVETRSG
jgi:hypothetical protein